MFTSQEEYNAAMNAEAEYAYEQGMLAHQEEEKREQDIFEILGISEYKKGIFHANSHGELFHLWDYDQMARAVLADETMKPVFLKFFTVIRNRCIQEGGGTLNHFYTHMLQIFDLICTRPNQC